MKEEEIKIICPECLEETAQEELNVFGGFCEECFNEAMEQLN